MGRKMQWRQQLYRYTGINMHVHRSVVHILNVPYWMHQVCAARQDSNAMMHIEHRLQILWSKENWEYLPSADRISLVDVLFSFTKKETKIKKTGIVLCILHFMRLHAHIEHSHGHLCVWQDGILCKMTIGWFIIIYLVSFWPKKKMCEFLQSAKLESATFVVVRLTLLPLTTTLRGVCLAEANTLVDRLHYTWHWISKYN